MGRIRRRSSRVPKGHLEGQASEFMNPVTGTITSLLSKEEIVSTFEPYFAFDKLEKIPFDNYLRYLCLMRKK